jgi:hypothetical protein
MLILILWGIVGPLAIIWLVTWFLKKYAKSTVPSSVARLYAERPIEPKTFRVVRFDGPTDGEPIWLGDYETQPEAVDAAYTYRKKEREEEPGKKSSFMVLNDRGDFLEEVDT